MASQVSPTVKDLLAQVAQLGDGLQNGQPGSREGLLGVCSALIGELSFPMETMLMLLWSQVFPAHILLHMQRLNIDLRSSLHICSLFELLSILTSQQRLQAIMDPQRQASSLQHPKTPTLF